MATRPKEEAMLDMVNQIDEADGTDYGDGPEDEEDIEGDDNDEEDAGDDDSEGGQDDDDNSDDDSESSDDSDGRPGVSTESRSVNQPDIKGLRPVPGGFLQDKNGNLYNAQGQLLARAGSERRLFERSQRQGSMLEEQRSAIERLSQENQQYKQAMEAPARLGINAEDLQIGYPIIADFKRDPVAATRKMLEMVLGMGHNLNEVIGGDGGQSLDMKAVSRMLEDRLAPLNDIRNARDQQQKVEQERRATEAAITRFVDEHEHSSLHLEAIDSLIGKNPGMTPERAYFEIRAFAQKHNLDFSKPLGPQIAGVQNQRQQPQRRQSPRNIPLPNGRSRPAVRNMDQGNSASATDTWDSIINRALSGQ
jgi:hypothetical protein